MMARQSFAAEMIHLTFSLLPNCSKEIQPWVYMSKNSTGNWLSTSALNFIDAFNYCVVSWQVH